MIKISKEDKYIKYQKCTSCCTDKNINAIIITNDVTNQDNIYTLCDNCLKKLGGNMDIKDVIYNFGKEIKKGYKKLNKEDKIKVISKNLLDETNKENIDFIYYLLIACADTHVEIPEESKYLFDNKNKELRQLLVTGLLSE